MVGTVVLAVPQAAGTVRSECDWCQVWGKLQRWSPALLRGAYGRVDPPRKSAILWLPNTVNFKWMSAHPLPNGRLWLKWDRLKHQRFMRQRVRMRRFSLKVFARCLEGKHSAEGWETFRGSANYLMESREVFRHVFPTAYLIQPSRHGYRS